jgi:predicted ATP-binding protein involved in virulence
MKGSLISLNSLGTKMPPSLSAQIIQQIRHLQGLYHHLIFLVAVAGAGKTAVLQEVHERVAAPLVNVNLELSSRMLELTARQRALRFGSVAYRGLSPCTLEWFSSPKRTI